MNPLPSTEAPQPRRVGPAEIEALHEIDQIIGNQDTLTAEELGEVRGIVLDTLNAWHQQFRESNLLAHAERELALAHVEEDVRPSLLAAVEAFTSYGHSGGSHFICAPMLYDLINYRALTPLTNDPDEWIDQSGISGFPVWQNIRDSEAMSADGGKTYCLLREHRRRVAFVVRYLPQPIRRRVPQWVLFPIHTAVTR